MITELKVNRYARQHTSINAPCRMYAVWPLVRRPAVLAVR
jgi:hypothetical protein